MAATSFIVFKSDKGMELFSLVVSFPILEVLKQVDAFDRENVNAALKFSTIFWGTILVFMQIYFVRKYSQFKK